MLILNNAFLTYFNPKETDWGAQCLQIVLSLFYTGFLEYTLLEGGSVRPLARCSLRQSIFIEMTKNGSQCKIVVYTSPYIPKTVFFDSYFSRERSQKELGYR